MQHPIGFIGYGEAGQAFAQSITAPKIAYDLRPIGDVTLEAMATSRMIFCLVTADQTLAAAQAAAPFLAPDTLWLDGNSCSPATKRQAAAVIDATGAHYVDMAIMAPVQPRGLATPVLISGPHNQAGPKMQALGMQVTQVGDTVGAASSIKMLRSVMIKGMEALTAEAFLAARRAGVADAVIDSLAKSDPGMDWLPRGSYNLERMLVHGTRRAAEMAEVAATLRDLGLPDRMSMAAMAWQAQLAALHLNPGPDDFARRADAILAALI